VGTPVEPLEADTKTTSSSVTASISLRNGLQACLLRSMSLFTNGNLRISERLSKEIKGAFRPNLFINKYNPEAHYLTTGSEIWEGTEGRIEVFVTGIGTEGTISGVGKFLNEKNPNIILIGADPEGSILSGDSPKPFKVEGIGEDFIPKTFNSQIADEWITAYNKKTK